LISAMRWVSGNNSAISFNFRNASPYPLQAQAIVDATTQWAWGLNNYYLRPQEGWRFFAVKHDGTQPYIFRNSKDITSLGSFTTSTDKKKWFKAIFTDASSKADNIAVGSSLNNSTAKYNLNGWADSVKIYGRDLTDAEVAECFYRTCTNYGYPAWVYDRRDWYSNASLIVSAGYPAESTVIPAQSIGFVSNNVFRYWGWGGTLVNGAYWTIKNNKGAYYHDAVNDYCNFGNFVSLNNVSNLTISMWFFLWKNPANNHRVYNKYSADGNEITLNIGGSAAPWRNNITLQNGTTPSAYTPNILYTNNWYHSVLVFNGAGASNADKLKYYINGQQKALTFSGTFPTKTPNNTVNFIIGQLSGGNFAPIYWSDLIIWAGNGSKYSLTSNEVYQLYLYGR